MRQIDRKGIFQAVPREWRVRTTDNSSAVAVSLDFDLLAQWNGTGWDDWSQYELHTAFGDYWVIKRDRTVNQGTVEQLAASLGWDGNLDSVHGDPPNVLVQITIKDETFQGKTRFKAGWMNPGDWSPGPAGAPPEEVSQLSSQFGSLLMAAAAGAAKQAKPVPAPARTEEAPAAAAPAAAQAPAQPQDGPLGPEPPPAGDDDLPY